MSAQDLDQWSDSLAAQTTLPILVRRLILATASVTEITMRAREARSCQLGDGSRPVRRRRSPRRSEPPGWELGTARTPETRLSRHRLVERPWASTPKTTTFVAVTSRTWRDRDDWRDARRKDGKWADVRAYDSDDLVTWLERA